MRRAKLTPSSGYSNCRDVLLTGSCAPHTKQASKIGGHKMNFGFIASLVIVIIGIVGVFIAIPIVSDYAFWVVVVAYIVLAGTR
jgi:hypothetical protein